MGDSLLVRLGDSLAVANLNYDPVAKHSMLLTCPLASCAVCQINFAFLLRYDTLKYFGHHLFQRLFVAVAGTSDLLVYIF